MIRYLVLIKFTDKGASQIQSSTSRAHEFNQIASKHGVTVEGQFWTIGSIDGAVILHSESEEKILRVLAELSASGYVRTQSIRAYTDQEFEKILNA